MNSCRCDPSNIVFDHAYQLCCESSAAVDTDCSLRVRRPSEGVPTPLSHSLSSTWIILHIALPSRPAVSVVVLRSIPFDIADARRCTFLFIRTEWLETKSERNFSTVELKAPNPAIHIFQSFGRLSRQFENLGDIFTQGI